MSSIDPGKRWYPTMASFKLESLFSQKRVIGPPRTVFVNQNLPDHYFDHKRRTKQDHVYSSNQVITSKYTIITFLPRNFLEQFRRIANLYVPSVLPFLFTHSIHIHRLGSSLPSPFFSSSQNSPPFLLESPSFPSLSSLLSLHSRTATRTLNDINPINMSITVK